MRRTDEVSHNQAIKCVVDPKRVRNFCLAHFFLFHGEPRVVVDENHRPVEGRRGSPFSKTDEVSFEKLRVNHYVTKSEEEFRRKQSRVRVDNGRPWAYTDNQTARLLSVLDQVEDRTIQMYLPALHEELARVEALAAARA